MTGDIQRTQDTLGRVIGLGKDLVALFRDGALLLLAILLLALPEKLNAILVKAGFEEGSVVGFKWKSKLVNSDQALKDANATISDLQKKSGELSTALTEVAAKLNDPKLREKAAALQADNRSLAMAAKEVQATLASTIEANTPFVTSALSAGDVKKWAVVFGGDASLDQARHETERNAAKYGIGNAKVFLRNGSYRSVSVWEDRESAEEALKRAKRLRPDSYTVSLSNWCPDRVEQKGYTECRR